MKRKPSFFVFLNGFLFGGATYLSLSTLSKYLSVFSNPQTSFEEDSFPNYFHFVLLVSVISGANLIWDLFLGCVGKGAKKMPTEKQKGSGTL